MARIDVRSLLWTAAAVLGAAAPAAAQVPSVGFVFPPGGQAGSTTTISISGGNLQEATAVLLSDDTLTAKITSATNAAALPVELKIPADAVPGMREVRVVTPRGTSNAGRIWVGPYPEANEAEPNNTGAAPQKLEKLPVTVNGQVNGGEDVDVFSFQAEKGDTFVFDLVSFRMASALDGFLQLQDARGKQLDYAQEGFDRDPRIIHTFKESGTYAIQVRDTLFRGGGNFVYKLTMGKVPVVTSYLPMAGQRGQAVTVSLEGANLGDMKTMQVTIPDDKPRVTLPLSTAGGMAVNPISLAATDVFELAEYEPNDAAAHAYQLSDVPVAVSGRIDKSGDVDHYRIKPAAAATLQFDLIGRRLGSRIDGQVRVLDAAGKVLAANDDAVGKDSRTSLQVAANTEYVVEVRNLAGSYGPDCFYRLVISAPGGQDFSMTVTPDTLNVPAGGSTSVTVNVARQNGFGGPVALRVENLPEGIVVSPAEIRAGANAVTFTLTAPAGAKAGEMKKVRIVGSAKIGDQTVERVAQPIEIYRQPLAAENQNSQRETLIFASTVMPQQAYALDLEQKAVTVKRGQSVEVKVKATRQMSLTKAITIAVAGQPTNVAPAPQPVPEKGTEVVLKINVAGNAPVGTYNLIVTGNVDNNIQTAPALVLTITE